MRSTRSIVHIGVLVSFGLMAVACAGGGPDELEDHGGASGGALSEPPGAAGAGRRLAGPVHAPAAPVELSDEALADIVRLRREIGFNADPERVRDLHARPGAYGASRSTGQDLLGLVMTDDEIAAMRTRNQLEHHASAMEARVKDAHPKTFAGLHVAPGDAEASTVIRVLFKDDPGKHRGELAGMLPEALRGNVVVERVDHSLAELLAEERKVDRVVRKLEREGVPYNATAADVLANRVTVFVPKLSNKLVAALKSEVRLDMLRFVEEGGRAAPTWLKNDQYAWALVAGGQRIEGPAGSCTSAFAAHGFFGPFMLTAGHCSNVDDMIVQGGATLGRAAAKNFGGNQDALAITTYSYRNQRGRIHRDASDFWSPIHGVIGLEGDPIGAVVCTTGYATTGLDGFQNPSGRCGQLTHKYVSISYIPNSTPSFRLANYWSDFGDSGAAIYWDTMVGTLGVGINSGKTGAGTGVFSHLPYTLDAWGLTLDSPE